jgi:hypothetical protein
MPKKKQQAPLWKIVLVMAILAMGFAIFSLTGNLYAGGWEVQNEVSSVTIDGYVYNYHNTHTIKEDIDGDFDQGLIAGFLPIEMFDGGYVPPPENPPDPTLPEAPTDRDHPDVKVSQSYPYYLEQSLGAWVVSESPVVFDTYDRDVSDSEFFRYNHYVFAYDLTIETVAEAYHKPIGEYFDYGYFFEADAVDVIAKSTFRLNPWEPTGSYEGWAVVDGWAGVMSASVLQTDYGLTDPNVGVDKEENFGHVIQGMDSVGSALNTHIGSFDFDSPQGLDNVPSSVTIENRAQLAAGAGYTTDWLGHWNSIAVRNVYAKYTIRVDVLTTLNYVLEAGAQDAQKPPEEDNTNYEPEVTPWKNLLAGIGGIADWIAGFGMAFLMPVIIIVAIIVIVIFVIRPLIKAGVILKKKGRRK